MEGYVWSSTFNSLPPPSFVCCTVLACYKRADTHTHTHTWTGQRQMMFVHSIHLSHDRVTTVIIHLFSSSGCVQTHIRSIHILMLLIFSNVCMCVCAFSMSMFQFPDTHQLLHPRVLELADGTVVYMADELLIMPSAGCPRCLTSHALRI